MLSLAYVMGLYKVSSSLCSMRILPTSMYYVQIYWFLWSATLTFQLADRSRSVRPSRRGGTCVVPLKCIHNFTPSERSGSRILFPPHTVRPRCVGPPRAAPEHELPAGGLYLEFSLQTLQSLWLHFDFRHRFLCYRSDIFLIFVVLPVGSHFVF